MLSIVALSVCALLTLCSFVGTALQYRFLPKTVNMNPSLGSMGMLLPRPAVFLLPLVQIGILVLLYSVRPGAMPPTKTRGSYRVVVTMPDGIYLLLLWYQMWLVRQAKEDTAM